MEKEYERNGSPKKSLLPACRIYVTLIVNAQEARFWDWNMH